MPFCSQCGQKALPSALFCAKCGANLKSQTQPNRGKIEHGSRQTQNNKPSSPQRTNEQGSNAEGVNAYKALMVIRGEKRVKGLLFFLVAVVLGLIAGFTFIKGLQTVSFTLGGACVLTAGIAAWIMPHQRLTQAEYAALPGAMVIPHGHKCIFCGGRGIYRHTPYKTNTTLADCSKCKNELWYE